MEHIDKKIVLFLAACLLIVGISLLYEDLYTVSNVGIWSYSSKYYVGIAVIISSIVLFTIGSISKEKERI